MPLLVIVALVLGIHRSANAGESRGVEVLGETLLGAATGAAGFGAGLRVVRTSGDSTLTGVTGAF